MAMNGFREALNLAQSASPHSILTAVFRAVPVPPELLDTLDMVHGIREAQRRGQAERCCGRGAA